MGFLSSLWAVQVILTYLVINIGFVFSDALKYIRKNMLSESQY